MKGRRLKAGSSRWGFTLLELMLAIGIFGMIITAIYTIWYTVLKGSKVGLDVAASVQRTRIAVRALEDAFVTSVMFPSVGARKKYLYSFDADTTGDMAEVSMVSRLPASFPGVGRYGDAVVRRVSFSVRFGPEGGELYMKQAPLLQDIEEVEPYSLVLAKEVTKFKLEFWDDKQQEWAEEWTSTNKMPKMVKILIGVGKTGRADPRDMVTRVVAMPSMAVQADILGGGVIVGNPPIGNP